MLQKSENFTDAGRVQVSESTADAVVVQVHEKNTGDAEEVPVLEKTAGAENKYWCVRTMKMLG